MDVTRREILLDGIYTADILVITSAHIHAIARYHTIKLRTHISFSNRFYTIVDKVAGDDHNIWLLAIYQLDVTCQVAACGAISEVDIARHNYAVVIPIKALVCCNLQMLDTRVAVVDISENEQ